MPHLVQMDKRYGKKGLQIIGAEVQRSSKDSIIKITDKFKVLFPITKGIQGPSIGSGIPRAIIFDVTGKPIYSGHPSDPEFTKTIKKALRNVTDIDNGNDRKSNLPPAKKPLIDQRTWTNIDNKKIEASALLVEGEKVEFKLPSGKKVKYPINKLSEEDQKMIKEAVKAKLLKTA